MVFTRTHVNEVAVGASFPSTTFVCSIHIQALGRLPAQPSSWVHNVRHAHLELPIGTTSHGTAQQHEHPVHGSVMFRVRRAPESSGISGEFGTGETGARQEQRKKNLD